MKKPETKDLSFYVRRFSRLRANPRAGSFSPHKPAMLLAVLESFEVGEIKENRIEFSPPLLARFSAIFHAARQNGDQCNAALPFFHLSGDGFWHLQAKPGKDAVLAVIRQIKTQGMMLELVECASLDPELFQLATQPGPRGILREAILDHWFRGATSQTIQTVLTAERQTATYQEFIKSRLEGGTLRESAPLVDQKSRTEAFRRCVAQAYDFRCAASGWRVILPDGAALVESAHLIPFANTFDDDPRNGMALTPTFHELMDARVIAPGPDLKWHVSPLIDDRVPDYRELCALHMRALLLPRDRRYYPRKDALEWRFDSLLR